MLNQNLNLIIKGDIEGGPKTTPQTHPLALEQQIQEDSMEEMAGRKNPPQTDPLDEHQQIQDDPMEAMAGRKNNTLPDPLDELRINEQVSLISDAEIQAREVHQAKKSLDLHNFLAMQRLLSNWQSHMEEYAIYDILTYAEKIVNGVAVAFVNVSVLQYCSHNFISSGYFLCYCRLNMLSLDSCEKSSKLDISCRSGDFKKVVQNLMDIISKFNGLSFQRKLF